MRWKVAASLLVCGVLSGCGGGGGSGDSSGGGGGGGSGSSNFRISLDRTNVAFDYFDGNPLPSTLINATSTGTLPTEMYVAATTTGTAVDQAVPITINPTTGTGTITMKAAAGLAPGQYSGTVQFYACSDQACKNPIGGTPIAVNYSVNVRRGLAVTPATVNLNALSGAGASAAIALTIPEGQTTYTVTPPTMPFNWIQVTGQTDSGFTLAARSMPSGSYSTSFDVSSGPFKKTIQVNYFVAAPPGGELPLGVIPTTLPVTVSEGDSVTKTLSVQAPTWAPDRIDASVQYQNSASTNWMTVTPSSGGFTLNISAQGLVAGRYTAFVNLRTVPERDLAGATVNLEVVPGLTAPTSQTLKVTSATRAADLQKTVSVPAAGGGGLHWSASTTADWVTFTRSQGVAGVDGVAFVVDSAKLQAWDNFSEHTAQIQIASGAAVTPVSFNVTVQKRLAEVTGLGPYFVTANEDTRLIIRGRGFSEINSAALATNLAISGNVTSTAQFVNDTELVGTLQNVSAGTHDVSVTSNLGFTLPHRAFTALVPVDFAYASIPSTDPVGPLLYDPQRRVLYGADLYEENTHVFRFDGSAWTRTIVPVPGSGQLGMQPDASAIFRYRLANQNGNQNLPQSALEERDPITLALRKSTTLPYGFAARLPTNEGLVIGNDGRAWLQELIWLTTYNLNTGEVQTVEHGNATYFDLSLFAMARNGERLIDAPVADNIPSRTIYYMDSADTVWHDSGVHSYFEQDLKINDDGSRIVLDFTTVLNEQFQSVGGLNLPGGAGIKATALPSPNGKRIYVLAVNNAGTGRPTVYVYDASVAVAGALPLLGSFDFPDFPTLCTNIGLCGRGWVKSTISPDGHTLFFSGDRNFVVVPIPQAYR